MSITFEQTLAYLATLNRFGINLGLSRIERLLVLMGNPERRYKTVHVTGTNGKGSTTAMLAAILTEAGVKTGMYTSPHLTSYTERMVIDGVQVTEERFSKVISHTSRFVDSMTAEGYEHPTEFEVITAAAFQYFAEEGVEYAVIEVGLGGLLDSTNVVYPEISVITNVTLEHTDRCGDTVEAIAEHKAGIIKGGVPVVTAAEGAAFEVISRIAAARQSRLYSAGADFAVKRIESGSDGQLILWHDRQNRIGPLKLRLLGCHQLINAALAIAASRMLGLQEERITEAAIARGLASVSWPGRFEVIAGRPSVVIDGAHNPAGANTLRKALNEYFPEKSITFVLGMLKDKDRQGIVQNLLAYGDRVITVAPDTERASLAEELLELVQAVEGVAVQAAFSLEHAIEKALKETEPDDVVCIAGSLYLVGPAREIVYSR